ncbi:MAG: N-acetylgalactosamine 6-sulfate sulfatase, partial [Rubripirellula sp.]
NDLASSEPAKLEKMIHEFKRWNQSVQRSVQGSDYKAGRLLPGDPEPRFWMDMKSYEPWFNQWRDRWEYESRLKAKRAK